MEKKASIYQYLQTEAAFGVLNQTDIAFFKKVCRWYSKTFHTPLHVVMECKKIQWDEILSIYYEEQMDNIPFNAVFDIACKDYIPELAEEIEAEDQAYADSLVEEQERTLKAKKARDKKKQKINNFSEELNNKANKVLNKLEDITKPPTMSLSFEDEEV